jgi:hypothetical protein
MESHDSKSGKFMMKSMEIENYGDVGINNN